MKSMYIAIRNAHIFYDNGVRLRFELKCPDNVQARFRVDYVNVNNSEAL